ncbi:MAG: agmatinase [Thermaerobacter sp.]|nr:agmatinase [Thermaerobacter sp.]
MNVLHPGRPLWAQEEPRDPRVELFGVPFDGTASFNAGSREGPLAIRSATHGLEDFSPALSASVPEGFLHDLGDLDLPFGNPAEVLRRTEAATEEILSRGRLPFLLGGEHLVTLGALRAHRRHGDFVLVQLDAHADLRHDYLGESLSHAAVLYHAQELLGRENVLQLGIRSASAEEWGRRGFLRTDLSEKSVSEAIREIGGRPIYLTLDIDVADPAFAPGTGTPEPGGATSQELLAAVRGLSALPLVGADIVEVLPSRDPAGITALLAAKCLREMLIAQGVRQGGL